MTPNESAGGAPGTHQGWKRAITLFLSAQTISLFGSSLVQYAIIWHVTLSTSSGKMLTISTLCGFLPQLLISLFAGVWVDRYDRKTLMMLADSAIALATLALALAFLWGWQSFPLLFAVLAIRSAGAGIQTPAVQAVIPQIVPQEHLMRINGIHSTLSSLTMFLSPAISGVILSLAPFETTLLVDVVTAIIGVGITATIPIRPHQRAALAHQERFAALRQGLRYGRQHPLVWRLLVYQLLVLFLISPSAFLTPLLVSRTFGPDVWRLTASEMTYSLGMISGGVLIAAWGGFRSKLRTTLLAGTVYGLLMIGLGQAPLFLLYLVCNTLIGVTAPCYNTPITVTIQERVEPAMQGRVFSFLQIATSCALPMGMLLFGPLADRVSVQSLLTGAGCAVVALSLLVWGLGWLEAPENTP